MSTMIFKNCTFTSEVQSAINRLTHNTYYKAPGLLGAVGYSNTKDMYSGEYDYIQRVKDEQLLAGEFLKLKIVVESDKSVREELQRCVDDKSAQIGGLCKRLREITQALVEEVGADGPMSAEEAAGRIISALENARKDLKELRESHKTLRSAYDTLKEASANHLAECRRQRMFYLQNIQAGFLGNSPMFWSTTGGYTQFIEFAETFTEFKADEFVKSDPKKWRKWSYEIINAKAKKTIDIQDMPVGGEPTS